MQAVGRASDRFRDWFTRVFTRVNYAPVESKGNFNGFTDDDDVYWFDSDSAVFGQATPVGTIILNRNRMENLSDEAAELVYRHEQGHLNRRPVFRGLFWGMVLNGAAGILFLLMSLGYSFLVPFGTPVEPVAMLAGVSLALVVLMLVTIRLEELAANLYALRDLGEERFLDAYDEIDDEGSDSLRNRVLTTLMYPRLNNVIRVYRFLTWARNLLPA